MTPEYASQIVFEQDIKKQDKMIENLKEADSKRLLKMCMKLIRGEDFQFETKNVVLVSKYTHVFEDYNHGI